MTGLLSGVLVFVALGGHGSLVVFLIAFLVMSAFATQFRRAIFPPLLNVKDGVFSVRAGTTFRTPASNVLDLVMVGGVVGVIFRDLGQVTPEGNRPLLARQLAQHGVHLVIGGESFTLDQINELRRALQRPPQTSDKPADRLSRFYATLAVTTPRAWVTPTIVLANVLVFAVMVLRGVNPLLPGTTVMIDWGANFAPLTTTGQWWRLLTSMFLHFGIMHLLFNMWVLWGVGKLVERLVGSTAFALAYLFSGFMGSVASVLWKDHVVSAGASGAVFGVFGLLVGFMSLQRKSIPIEAIKEHRNSALAFLAFNILFGFSIQWIDMAAHVGGLVTGLACGLLLSQEISRDALGTRRVRTAVLAIAGIALCSAAVVFLPPRGGGLTIDDVWVAEVDEQAEAIHQRVREKLARKTMSAGAAADQIEDQIISRYDELLERLRQSGAARDEDGPKAKLLEYVQLRQEGWRYMAAAVRAENLVDEGRALEKFEAAAAVPRERPYGSSAVAANRTDLRDELARFVLEEQRALERYDAVSRQVDRREIDEQRLADALQRDVLPAWRAACGRFTSAVAKLPQSQDPAVVDLKRYMQLQEESWIQLARAIREGDKEKQRQSLQNARAAAQLRPQIWFGDGP
jgi:membrane associated rhomboid family serine protease